MRRTPELELPLLTWVAPGLRVGYKQRVRLTSVFSASCQLAQNLSAVALSKLDSDFTLNPLKRMVGLEGFEPPTHGLGNPYTTVHPVRIHDFSVGYSGSHSDPKLLFGHDNAPHDAPRAQRPHEKSNGFPLPAFQLGHRFLQKFHHAVVGARVPAPQPAVQNKAGFSPHNQPI